MEARARPRPIVHGRRATSDPTMVMLRSVGQLQQRQWQMVGGGNVHIKLDSMFKMLASKCPPVSASFTSDLGLPTLKPLLPGKLESIVGVKSMIFPLLGQLLVGKEQLLSMVEKFNTQPVSDLTQQGELISLRRRGEWLIMSSS